MTFHSEWLQEAGEALLEVVSEQRLEEPKG